MKKIISVEAVSVGLAMFSMFFGAGNVIFPLAVGQYAQNQNWVAMIGLIFGSVVMPFAGVIAMIQYEGNYQEFFGRLGKSFGFILSLIIISLLGPLGSTPRCIALTHSTLKSSFPMISPVLFSALSCVIIYLFTYKKSRTLELLGKFLTPLLIIALCAIVTVGFITEGTPSINSMAKADLFLHGLKEGYNTMDLLAAFFFSSTVLSFLKSRFSSNDSNPSNPIHISLQASLIGAVLLSLTYIGFSMIAAIHGNDVSVTSKDELLSAMILKIVGPSANLLVSITVGLACLTTAIALISVFSDFAHREVFKEKVSYRATLIGSLLITFCISTLEFEGISKMLGPILEICYPGLIVLTLLNILYRTTGFKIVKTPVFLTFLASAWVYFK